VIPPIRLEFPDAFGKGIFKQKLNDIDVYYHSGRIDQFRSILGYHPKTNDSIAIMSNGAHIDQKEIINALLKARAGQLVAIPTF